VTRILHFSDVHVERGFSKVPLSAFFNKRAIGFANLRLRRGPHFMDAIVKMNALALFMEEEGVDLCVCTGDHTALGTDPELRLAREVIDPLTKAPLGFVTVPGNHDLYLPDAADGRFERHFGDLLGTDLPDLSVDGLWPQVRLVRDDLAIVAINSARPNPEVMKSSGFVPTAQLEALGKIIRDPRVAGRFIIVATHYALCRPDGSPDRPGHGIDNYDAVIEALRPIEKGAFLHGHIHWRFHARLAGLRIDLCGAGSATHKAREGFWVLDVEDGDAVATPGTFHEGRYFLEPHAAMKLGGTG
jgi:3',5'-cyclic AMP phosphodiesterase CpdA